MIVKTDGSFAALIIIDNAYREGADCISKEGLKFFYEKFAGLSGAELEKTTEQGFKTATAVSQTYVNMSQILSSPQPKPRSLIK